MKENWINNVHIEGRIFSHTLQKRVSGEKSKNPGTEFIQGQINVATDEDGINVVPVRFTYITEFYSKSGKPNDTYKILQEIIDKDVTWENSGKDAAPQIRIDGDIAVNDFPGRDGEMVEAKCVRGSFVHYANGSYGLNADENKRNTFEADMLIAATQYNDNEDGNVWLNLRGYVFAYQNALVPVVFSLHNQAGIDYFLKCDISNDNPLLTKVWGNIISTTQEIKREVESAFGGTKVDITTRTLRAWEIAGCAAEPYEWNDESTMTWDYFKTLLDERAQTVAAAKQRAEEYQASQNTGKSAFNAPAANTSAAPNANFKF